jgi:hypothetical protein
VLRRGMLLTMFSCGGEGRAKEWEVHVMPLLDENPPINWSFREDLDFWIPKNISRIL